MSSRLHDFTSHAKNDKNIEWLVYIVFFITKFPHIIYLLTCEGSDKICNSIGVADCYIAGLLPL